MAALPRTVLDLRRLDWAAGACIAIALEGEPLTVVAADGLPERAEEKIARMVEGCDPGILEAGLFIEDTDRDRIGGPLRYLGIGGIALVSLTTVQGPIGFVAITAPRTLPMPEGHRTFLRSIGREIAVAAEHTRLARAAEENRRLAESVLSEMSDGVVVIDSLGLGRVCNPAAAALLNVSQDRAVGSPANEWLTLPTPIMDALWERATRRDAALAPLEVELAGRQLAIQCGPFVDLPGRQSEGLILLIRDLTNLLAAERAKQDFVSMVGHELRTPLTMIRATTDMLGEQDAGSLTPTQTRITEILRGNADRLLALVNDLLDVSALGSGRVHVAREPIDLLDVLDETIEAFERQACEHDLELRLVLPPGITSIPAYADRSRIRQVLSNLVGNAIKYTPRGGHIRVCVEAGPVLVRVDVQDDGIGIAPEDQAHLFEKFYRAAAGQRQSSGTGLGLTIARSIVELHGGMIWCESDGTHGSTFSFRLPVSCDPD